MSNTEKKELKIIIETFELATSVEPAETHTAGEPTPKPEQIVRYLAKLEDIARARQSAEQRSGELFLR